MLFLLGRLPWSEDRSHSKVQKKACAKKREREKKEEDDEEENESK